MVEVPEPGTGTVSLNLGANNTPTATKNDNENTGKAFAIPVIDTEDNPTGAVADLATAGGEFTQAFKQTNMRTWIVVLAAALCILAIVFVVLARQTSLFQGNLQGSLADEAIIQSPTNTDPNFDTNSDNTDPEPTGNTGSNLPAANNNSSLPNQQQPIELATGTENDPNAILSQLLGLGNVDGSPTNTTPDQQPEPIVNDNGPVVDNSPAINDPEFENTTTSVNNEPVITTQQPLNNNEPILGNINVTPVEQNITPLPQPAQNQQTATPTLQSNTNANVLASAQVSGNTGPGWLIYFGAPTLAYILRKKRS